jgi:hypothetical protein
VRDNRSRRGRARRTAAVLAIALVAGCGRPAANAGFLVGDPETHCVWGEEPNGTRYSIALPPGWTSTTDPFTAIQDEDGEVFVREGELLWGGEAQFPWWRSGDIVCEVEGGEGTVRFSELHPPASHVDDEPGK